MNAYLLGKIKEKGWLAQDADTSKVNAQEICGQKMASGDLSMEEFGQWCAEAKAQNEAKSAEQQNRLKAAMAEANAPVLSALTELVGVLKGNATKPATEPDADELAKAADLAAQRRAGAVPDSGGTDPAAAFKAAGSAPRVKKASESYSNTKSTLCYSQEREAHPSMRVGNPALMYEGSLLDPRMSVAKTINTTSEAEYAKIGAWAKWQIRKSGAPVRLNEHEMQLVKEVAHEDRFVGEHFDGRKMSDYEVKTVLDDSTSGGQEAVPEYFDTAIITTPLLHGELAPYVTQINVPRGSSADAFSIGTPTFVSTASGSAITPFTTTSFVTAFDTNFFPASCAFEIGLDFESDAVPNFGAAVVNQIGQEAMRWLDEQIAVGDGTTEPQGIFTATGTAVSAANGTTGAVTYNDSLNLVFAMSKAARNALGGNRVRFVGHDTNYKFFMQVATGVTGDTRPIFGMKTQSYMLGEYPFSVQNNVTVGDVAFCNLAAYRLYRRQGIQFSYEDRGSTLMLANKRLILARMRYGGKLTLPTTYCMQMLNAQAS
jgi:HK97 family phage major capsid protein